MPEHVEEIKYSRFVLPFGPVHPSLKEPLGVRVTLDKEIVEAYELSIGFACRGIERLATTKNLVQAMHLIERVCGICSSSHSMCFAQGIEAIGDLAVEEHAQLVRTLMAELERIHSHLLCIGITAYQMGFDAFFMDAFTTREKILDVFERVTGNRIHHGINAIGGTRVAVHPGDVDVIRKHVHDIEAIVPKYEAFLHEGLIKSRLKSVGILKKEDVVRLGLVGPVARASGLTADLRKDAPYAGYGEVRGSFSVITRSNGDAYDRNEARILEIEQSCRIIHALLDAVPGHIAPSHDHPLRIMRRVPQGHVTSRIEAPRGTLAYDVHANGKEGLDKLGIVTPTVINIKALDVLLVGAEFSDVPVIIASLDPCISCMDR